MSEKDPYIFDGADSTEEEEDDGMVNIRFQLGDIVAVKGKGKSPYYWPAMVDIDPDTNEFYWVQGENKTAATHYNVVFFEKGKVRRRWELNSRIAEYAVHYPHELTEMELETDRKVKSANQGKNLVSARRLAEEAMKLDVEDRTKKYSFIQNYKGKITLFDTKPPKKPSLTKDGKVKKKTGPKEASASLLTRRSIASSEPSKQDPNVQCKPARKSAPSQEASASLLTRRSIASSEPSKLDPNVQCKPARKSATSQESSSSSSLKLRITKDKNNGKHYSSKLSVTRDAIDELAVQLSDFAQSFPPSPGSGVPLVDMPKKRGRKRKAKSKASPKKAKSSEVPPPREPTPVDRPSSVDDVICISETETSSSQPTLSSLPGSSSSPTKQRYRKSGQQSQPPPTVPSPPCSTPPTPAKTSAVKKKSVEQGQRLVGIALPNQQVPPEETMANKMNDVIQRMQTQQKLPDRLLTKKTVSNVGLVVDHEPTIDLTGEDEPEAITWGKGEVVFAHLNGLQPWPAVIDGDPNTGHKHLIPSTGGPVELVHVVFLELNKQMWVPVKNVNKFSQKNLQTMTTTSHKFVVALEKANAAVTMSASDRMATYGTLCRRVSPTHRGGEPIVLD